MVVCGQTRPKHNLFTCDSSSRSKDVDDLAAAALETQFQSWQVCRPTLKNVPAGRNRDLSPPHVSQGA